jgi:hypothetical protein
MSVGAPELVVLFTLAVVVGGAFITIDAVTRPADRYRVGSKGPWVLALVVTNPLVTRWFGGFLWLLTMPVFIGAAVVYYAANRHRNPTPRPAWQWALGVAIVAAILVGNAALLLYSLGLTGTAAVPMPTPSDAELVAAPDGAMLLELRDAGSNLSRPHAFAFLLFLPDEASAARAGRALREQGFAVEVKESVGGDQWQARGTKMMVPDEAELIRLRAELDALAEREGGEYGGWQAPVVK